MAFGSLALAPLAQQQTTNVSNTVDLTINLAGYVSATAPSNPVNGQIWVYTADATNGIDWLFMYRSGSASSYKWEFVGGKPLFAAVETSENTASVPYVALATAGPSIVLPFAGDYDVMIGCEPFNDTAANGSAMSYDIGGTGAVDADWVTVTQPTVGVQANVSIARPRRKAGLSAVTLTAKYRATVGGTATFAKRWIEVTPVRTAG